MAEAAHASDDSSQLRGKRKFGDTVTPRGTDDPAETLDFRPVKRVSLFLNTPKQRKEERRKILGQAFEKMQRIVDPEKCLLKSVLLHNTARRMQKELLDEAGSAYWQAMAGGCRYLHPQLYEMDVLNSNYWNQNNMYEDPRSFKSETDDLSSDALSKALERTVCSERPKDDVPSSGRNHMASPVPQKPLSSVPTWDYQSYAASLTGAPLIAGGITMGTPINKEPLPSSGLKKPLPTPTEMDLEDAASLVSLDADRLAARPSPPPSSSVDVNDLELSLTEPEPVVSPKVVKPEVQAPPPADSSASTSLGLVTSATTLATFSRELDSLMAEYLSCSSSASPCSLSCVYMKSDSDKQLVPVLGGL